MTLHSGGCRCGAVRFEAAADPFHVSYCHCEDCRGASGAPVSAFVGFQTDNVVFHETRPASRFGVLPITRAFCGVCGSPLFYTDQRLKGQVYFMLGAMDEPQKYPPSVHGYVREQLPFFHINDGLPRRETTTVPRPDGA